MNAILWRGARRQASIEIGVDGDLLDAGLSLAEVVIPHTRPAEAAQLARLANA